MDCEGDDESSDSLTVGSLSEEGEVKVDIEGFALGWLVGVD